MRLQHIFVLGHFATACCLILSLACVKIASVLIDWKYSKLSSPDGG